jgi:hypothetical protein
MLKLFVALIGVALRFLGCGAGDVEDTDDHRAGDSRPPHIDAVKALLYVADERKDGQWGSVFRLGD